jgi:hypothetical protein
VVKGMKKPDLTSVKLTVIPIPHSGVLIKPESVFEGA